ncbi:hypothetical protein F4678DRAFT_444897 [Xylaria arbuscula]|nr:hypothetical protein F4678DRAFT_444897 [Xylaria arbuscula]
MQNRIPHALDDDQAVYSAMTNSQKDSSIIVRTAGEKSVPVRLVAVAERIYQTTVFIGWAGMGDAALKGSTFRVSLIMLYISRQRSLMMP